MNKYEGLSSEMEARGIKEENQEIVEGLDFVFYWTVPAEGEWLVTCLLGK